MTNSARHVKRNRVAVNLEDSIYDGLLVLAVKQGTTISELTRGLIISELLDRDMLHENAVKELMGI